MTLAIRREHVLAACVTTPQAADARFWQSVIQKNYPEFEQVAIADKPPPRREIVYRVKFYDKDELLSSSSANVFALAATESVFLSGRSFTTDTLNFLEGYISRLTSSHRLKHYGLNIILLFSLIATDDPVLWEQEEKDKLQLYTFMKSWCKKMSSETGTTITFDFVENESHLSHVFRLELWRIMNGDMGRQYASLEAASLE